MFNGPHNRPPQVLFVMGPTGSGTSRLAGAILAALGPEQCTVLSLDRFPDGDEERATSELVLLRSGRTASCPLPTPDAPGDLSFSQALEPAPLILVEGETNRILHLPRGPQDAIWVMGSQAPDREDGLTGPNSSRLLVLEGTRPLVALVRDALAWLEGQGFRVAPVEADLLLTEAYCQLAARMGMDRLGKRLERQALHWAGLDHQGEGLFFIERWIPLDRLAGLAMDAIGLGRVGRRAARQLRVERHVVASPCVPPDLDGFTLLQLSDLHLDLETGMDEVLRAVLPGLAYDVAVITGDYRNSTRDNYDKSIMHTAQLLAVLRPPIFGILGNHDFIEMAAALEGCGLHLLLNEAVFIGRGNARVYMAGLDDPHFYRTHDLDHVSHMPPDADVFRILLSHSPETWSEAEGRFDLLLAGHTHGGQICLPGGFPVIRNGRCPARMLAGAWQEGSLRGYTSRGTGCCGVPMRFFCPPEITLHTLRSIRPSAINKD